MLGVLCFSLMCLNLFDVTSCHQVFVGKDSPFSQWLLQWTPVVPLGTGLEGLDHSPIARGGEVPFHTHIEGAKAGRCLFVDSVCKQDALQLFNPVSVYLCHSHEIPEPSRRPPVLFC